MLTFIMGGIHVREAFIRSLIVGGHRNISLAGMLSKGKFKVSQNVMTQNSSKKKSIFFRRENYLSTDDAKLTSCQL